MHSPRLEGAQFLFGGAQAVIWGARPQYAPVEPGLLGLVPLRLGLKLGHVKFERTQTRTRDFC